MVSISEFVSKHVRLFGREFADDLKSAFRKVEDELGIVKSNHESLKSEVASTKTELAALKTQLAAKTTPAVERPVEHPAEPIKEAAAHVEASPKPA